MSVLLGVDDAGSMLWCGKRPAALGRDVQFPLENRRALIYPI
jgi:hypothetical protein